jgi:hypothetical protein
MHSVALHEPRNSGGASRIVMHRTRKASASRGAYWLLPDSARLEVVPNASHLIDEREALEGVVAEAQRWFGRTLERCATEGETAPLVAAGMP